MATRTKRTELAPGEELIGTITPHGIRLTRAAWRAQLAYRERERERAEALPTRGLLSRMARRRREPEQGDAGQGRVAHRLVEWRVWWRSDAPLRLHFTAVRLTVPADAPTPAAALTGAASASRARSAGSAARRTRDAPPTGSAAAAPGPERPESALVGRRESPPRRQAVPQSQKRRSERAAAGPVEPQPRRLQTARGSGARSRPT